MKSTGVVRKIDNLGRVVIPKEIRRTLKINEGSPLEIYIERDMIALKKHTAANTLKEVAYLYAESVYNSINSGVIITDREKILAISGLEEIYQNHSISEYLEDCIKNRVNVVENNKTKIEFVKGKEEEEEYCYIINLIESNGEVIGLVIIFNDFSITELEEKTSNLVAQILSKYIEE